MSFITNPIYVLGVLSLMVLLSIHAGKTKLGKQFGAALLVILFTAVVANLNLIPSASNSIGLYSVIFNYIAPISIFYLLLNVNLNSIRKAGLPMISLFIIGSLATTLGILISWTILSPETVLGKDAKVIAGMLTGTYTGGSVNFNAVALEFEVQKKGTLYAGTIAVDNVITTLWIRSFKNNGIGMDDNELKTMSDFSSSINKTLSLVKFNSEMISLTLLALSFQFILQEEKSFIFNIMFLSFFMASKATSSLFLLEIANCIPKFFKLLSFF